MPSRGLGIGVRRKVVAAAAIQAVATSPAVRISSPSSPSKRLAPASPIRRSAWRVPERFSIECSVTRGLPGIVRRHGQRRGQPAVRIEIRPPYRYRCRRRARRLPLVRPANCCWHRAQRVVVLRSRQPLYRDIDVTAASPVCCQGMRARRPPRYGHPVRCDVVCTLTIEYVGASAAVQPVAGGIALQLVIVTRSCERLDADIPVAGCLTRIGPPSRSETVIPLVAFTYAA